MRVAIYTRVSTVEQMKHGASIEAQEAACRGWAALMKHEVVAVHYDMGVSGTVPPEERPGMKAALHSLVIGQVEGLIATRLDRLSRSVIDAIKLTTRFQRQGWSLFSLGESLDTTTPMGKFTLTIMAAFSELERNMIGTRTTETLQHLKAAGKRYSKNAPWGKRVEGDLFVPDPEELALIQRMVEWRKAKITKNGMIAILESEGHVNPRSGKPWNVDSITVVLKSAVSSGLLQRQRRPFKTKRRIEAELAGLR